MVSFLLALVVLVILLQAGVMAMLRKLLPQLESQRARIAALEQRLDAAPAPPPPPSSATFHLRAAPAPVAVPQSTRTEPAIDVEPPLGATRMPSPPPARADDAERLRGEMLELMHQLVAQGMSVRDIAARCGLSEAEAELMLRLRDGGA